MPRKSSAEKGENFRTAIKTEAGWVGLLASQEGLLRCSFPQMSEDAALDALGVHAQTATRGENRFAEIAESLRKYFRGEKVQFTCPLDLGSATRFENAVWTTTQTIPQGETRSYAWIARQIGKPGGPRAVGQALGRNPLPIIIPCHRVLRSDGTLGGFGGGLKMKQYLLDIERSNP